MTNCLENNLIGVSGYLCLDMFPDLDSCVPFSFVPGMLLEVGSCPASPGGVVGNTGIALHRLGARVRLLARTGDDLFGNYLGEHFRKLGLREKCELLVTPGSSSGYCIVLSPPGEDRMFLACAGVNAVLKSADYPESWWGGMRMFHFAYPPLCKAMRCREGAELVQLYRKAHRHGIVTSLDMSVPSPGSFSYDMDWVRYLRNVLPHTDFFLPSIDELLFMLRRKPGIPDGAALHEISDFLLGCGTGAVMIKLGRNGIYFRSSSDPERLKILRRIRPGWREWRGCEFRTPACRIRAAGATGAGDASIAGFLAGLAGGYGPEAAVRLAVGTAACAVMRRDSIAGIPSLEKVTEFLETVSMRKSRIELKIQGSAEKEGTE